MTPASRLVTWALSTITIVVLLFGYHTSTAGALQSGSSVLGAQQPGTLPDAPGGTGSGSGSGGGTGGGSGGGSGGGLDSGSDGGSGSGSNNGNGSGDSSGSASGTVTGPSVQTQWGPVQVEITVENGRITDVAVPVYPYNNPRDVQINSYALPILVQETLDNQNADIDMISGATVTSVGYVQSLQAALDEAGL